MKGMALHFRLLGTAVIKKDGAVVKLGGKTLALLAYLLVSGKSHSREHLMDLFFDEAADPRGSLRWLLNQVQKAVGKAAIAASRQEIGFNFATDYWLDVEAFEAGQLSHYQGDLLAGHQVRDAHRFEDWLFFERERLRLNYERMLSDQLETSQKRGDYRAVIDLAHQLLRQDNLQEGWYRVLMQAYALLGNMDAAVAQFELCRQTFHDELGVEPGRETQALYQAIQQGTLEDPRSLAELPVQFPPFLADKLVKERRPANFVARERELAWLEQALGEAISGQGRLTFVLGGPGRGKTALMDAFARQAQINHSHLLVAQGNCNAFAGLGDPFLPFRDVMEMLTGNVSAPLQSGALGQEHARRLWGALLVTCQALLEFGPNLLDVLVSREEVAARAKTAVSHHSYHLAQLNKLDEGPPETAAELKQEFLFQQFTNVLKTISERFPLLILLDDLQWADATSISLLFHLGRRLGEARILIVGAYRPEEVAVERNGRRHPLQKVTAEFKRLFGEIELDLGLTETAENRNFVGALLESEPNRFKSAFREALFQHTGGHALFTVELLRAMQERGDLVQNEEGQWEEGARLDWDQLPARVEAVIAERIGRLEADLRQVLTVASVDGEAFTAQVVARVQEINERRLLQQLSQTLARQHRLIQEQGELNIGEQILSRYKFAHALFQRYLYNELTAGERRLLHKEVGTVLESLYRSDSVQIAVQLASHFEAAQDVKKAGFYLRLAGENAYDKYAYDESAMFYTRALSLEGMSSFERRYEILIARQKSYHAQSAFEKGFQDTLLISQIAESLDDNYKRAEVSLLQSNYAEANGNFERSIELAEKTTQLARENEFVEFEVSGLLMIGKSLMRLGSATESQHHLENALKIAQKNQLQKLEADSLNMLGNVAYMIGNHVEAKQFYLQSLDIRRQINNKVDVAWSLNNLGALSATIGEYDQAITFFEQGLRIDREIKQFNSEGIKQLNIGILSILLGIFEDAKKHLERALQTSQETGVRKVEAMAYAHLGEVHFFIGAFDTAVSHFSEGLTIANEIGDSDVQGLILLRQGDILLEQGLFDQAANLYHQVIELQQERQRSDHILESQIGLAKVSFSQGNFAEAQAWSKKSLHFLQENDEISIHKSARSYLICFQVLQSNHDPQAGEILQNAYTKLMETAAKIQDKHLRHSFLNNVAANRAIIAAYEEQLK